METPKSETLGHFEQLLLTAIMQLGGESYGVPIYDKVCELAEKRVNQGSLYLTLDRLNEKGLLSSWEGERTKGPGGRPKRFYRLEDSGLRALQDSYKNAKRFAALFEENDGGLLKWIRKRIAKHRKDNREPA